MNILQQHIVHEFREIRQNKGHYAVQGHSMSHRFSYQSKAHIRFRISD